ncbi:MAG: type II toxin-antitoxin system death-on-curing family toxin [Balneolaceae bacterium]|nr:type II toxin-antitoxin system death-on-curing family toxin [Balneolaceae bacterium]
MNDPSFLSLEDILFIHNQEIQAAGGEPNIRDNDGIKACVEAPKASFSGEYLQDLFGMAASYIACLTTRHPFVDGNKRTALASALTFLYLNGYGVEESHDEELADLVLDFVTKKKSKEDVAKHLAAHVSLKD